MKKDYENNVIIFDEKELKIIDDFKCLTIGVGYCSRYYAENTMASIVEELWKMRTCDKQNTIPLDK